MKQAMSILWPSFLVAAAAEGLFFSLFDPMDLQLSGGVPELSRLGVYTIGFLLFWLFAAASSALTCYLRRSAAEVNRCPLDAGERPPGCPIAEHPPQRG
jgi:hypothetical protein